MCHTLELSSGESPRGDGYFFFMVFCLVDAEENVKAEEGAYGNERIVEGHMA